MAPKSNLQLNACSSPPPNPETSTSGTRIGLRRKLLSSEVIHARDLREKHAEAHIDGLEEIMNDVWGPAPKTRRGFKEGRVQNAWREDFFKYYALVYGKKQVTNHYISTYFARAFALHLKGRVVDWVDVARTAKDLAKNSDVTEEPTTGKSSNIKQELVLQQNVRALGYSKSDLEVINQLITHGSEERINLLNEIEELEARRRDALKVISRFEGRKEMLEEDLQQISQKVEETKLEFDKLAKDPSGNQVSYGVLKYRLEDLVMSRTEKESHSAKLDDGLKEATKEIEKHEISIKEAKEKLSCMELLQQRHTQLLNFMGRAGPLDLHPRPFPIGATAVEQFISFSSCTCCGQGFGKSGLVLLAPCRDAYCLFCLSYLAHEKQNCIRGCIWDDGIRSQLGLPAWQDEQKTISMQPSVADDVEPSSSTRLTEGNAHNEETGEQMQFSSPRSPTTTLQPTKEPAAVVPVRDWQDEVMEIERQAVMRAMAKGGAVPSVSAPSPSAAAKSLPTEPLHPSAKLVLGKAPDKAPGAGASLSADLSVSASSKDDSSVPITKTKNTDPDFNPGKCIEEEAHEEEVEIESTPKGKQKNVAAVTPTGKKTCCTKKITCKKEVSS